MYKEERGRNMIHTNLCKLKERTLKSCYGSNDSHWFSTRSTMFDTEGISYKNYFNYLALLIIPYKMQEDDIISIFKDVKIGILEYNVNDNNYKPRFQLSTDCDKHGMKYFITLDNKHTEKILNKTDSIYKLMYMFKKYYEKDFLEFYQYMNNKTTFDNFLLRLKMYTLEYHNSEIAKAINKDIITVDIYIYNTIQKNIYRGLWPLFFFINFFKSYNLTATVPLATL